MLKKFSTADKLLFAAAILSLVFSELLYFQGEKEDGTFIGLWVPSILKKTELLLDYGYLQYWHLEFT